MRPDPKPTPRPKKPRKPLRAKHWGVSRSKRGTAHSRREREWGRMAYARGRGCGVREALLEALREDGVRFVGDVYEWLRELPTFSMWAVDRITGQCGGPIQYMHLHLGKTAGRRRAPDHSGAPGCETHHQGIDGKVGGKAPWYVALGFDGQQALKWRLVAYQRARWDLLTPDERAHWDEVGEARRRRPRAGCA